MELLNNFDYDFIRLQFYIPDDYSDYNFLISVLTEAFSKYKNVKLDFK